MSIPVRCDCPSRRTNITLARRIMLWGPAASWAAVIFMMSSIPGSELPSRDYSVAAHFGTYAILGTLVYVALRPGRTAQAAACLAIALSSAYGVSDEIHQAFVPGRTPDVMDWVVDTIGAATGVGLVLLLGRYRLRFKRS